MTGYIETKNTMEKVSEEESDMDSMKGKTLEEMSSLVMQLSRKVSTKKTQLAPLIAELRPLREEFRDLSSDYEEKRRIYEATASGLENSTAKLQEVRFMIEDYIGRNGDLIFVLFQHFRKSRS